MLLLIPFSDTDKQLSKSDVVRPFIAPTGKSKVLGMLINVMINNGDLVHCKSQPSSTCWCSELHGAGPNCFPASDSKPRLCYDYS